MKRNWLVKRWIVLGVCLVTPVFFQQTPALILAQDKPMPQELPPPNKATPTELQPNPVAAADKPLPINLPTALRLADASAWDIAIAAEREREAAAVLLQAQVLWLPTLAAGVDFEHHDGPTQNADGSITNGSRSSLYLGAAPFALFAVTDAIFEPLAARRELRAVQAHTQAVTNDTLFSVAQAYFNVQQARGELASAEDVYRRTTLLVERIEKMAPELVPTVEVARVRGDWHRVEQSLQTARENWRVASAQLVDILRMDATAMVDPQEPPQLQISLIPPDKTADELIPIAMTFRPELAQYQELVQASLEHWRQEKARPFLPTLIARGQGVNSPPYPMMFGGFAAGSGGSVGGFALRADYDVEAMWELKNMGLGNLALINQRRSQYEITRMQFARTQDAVAREVAQAVAEVQSAVRRVKQAENEVRESITSAQQNYDGLGQVKLVQGKIYILIIRPQEVVAAMQALQTAYYDYYGATADYNRAQFRLYRALGNPAQMLSAENQTFQPVRCPCTPAIGAPVAPFAPSKPHLGFEATGG
jgi:outer membrane protein TolC